MIYRDVKNKSIKNIINFLSSVSYEFFLVHHIILFKVFDKYGDKNLKQIENWYIKEIQAFQNEFIHLYNNLPFIE